MRFCLCQKKVLYLSVAAICCIVPSSIHENSLKKYLSWFALRPNAKGNCGCLNVVVVCMLYFHLFVYFIFPTREFSQEKSTFIIARVVLYFSYLWYMTNNNERRVLNSIWYCLLLSTVPSFFFFFFSD